MGNPLLGLKEELKKFIKENTSTKGLDLYVITGANYSTQTYSIKQLNINKQYDNVPICGQFLGNLRGFYGTYRVNDIVLVCFLNNSSQPVILGSLFDTYTNSKDNVVALQEGEGFFATKENSDYIYFKSNGRINVKNELKGCRVYQSSTSSVTNSYGSLAFQAESFDSSNMHDNTTNNSRITIVESGYYSIGGVLTAASASYALRLRILVDGSTEISASIGPVQQSISCQAIYYLNAGQYVELQGYSGTTQNSSGADSTHFWAYKIGN